jgi:hypothetical protein
MLCFHEKLREIKGPDSHKLIFRTNNAKGLIYGNRVNGRVVNLESSFQLFVVVIYLEDHTMF